MTTPVSHRVPAGIPAGGQFNADIHGESAEILRTTGRPSCAVAEPFKMPASGLTMGDESLPLYRSFARPGLSDLPESVGLHWTHDLEQAKSYALDDLEHAPDGFVPSILVIDHPGFSNVMSWDDPDDQVVLHETVMGVLHDEAEPEVPIRPGTRLKITAVMTLTDPDDDDESFVTTPTEFECTA